MTRAWVRSGAEKLAPLILRLVLGGIFVYAGGTKTRNPQALADAIAAYRILPEALVNVFALALPPFEVLLGLWLVIGWRLRSAAFCAACTLLVFWSALASARLRGLHIDCGCFGEASRPGAADIGALALTRDGALTAFALLLYWMSWRNARSAAAAAVINTLSLRS